MKRFRTLLVEDQLERAETFLDNLKTVPLRDLAGAAFDELEIIHVTNQEDADKAIEESQSHNFDLILLDLRYPLQAHLPPDDEDREFQGMKWLPTLRAKQPNAAIVILTSYAESRQLQNVVQAIRDYQADDFIPKTEKFHNIIARIRVAWSNAERVQQLRLLEEEFRSLIRTRAARTYAEDIGQLLNRGRASLLSVAGQLESGDPSLVMEVANAIRAQFSHLMKEFDLLTELLTEGDDTNRTEDVVRLISKMLQLYRRKVEVNQVKVIPPDEAQSVEVNTYFGDLKLALHEVINNALDSFEGESQRLNEANQTPSALVVDETELDKERPPAEERTLAVTVEEGKTDIVIRVTDSGPGLTGEARSRKFERGFSTKKNGHLGLGLYIAKRMMNHIGGTINVDNRPEGGVEAVLTLKDLRRL